MRAKLSQDALEVGAFALLKKMFMVIDRMDPAAYQKFYDSEHERWGRYIRAANISLD